MRRAAYLVVFVFCSGLPTLFLIALAIVWYGEIQALVLPGAADVQIARTGLSSQNLTYRLPAGQPLADVSARLVQAGWSRDLPGEQAVKRDQSAEGTRALFWRNSWLGLISQVVTVSLAENDPRQVEFQLSRCFKVRANMGCL